MRRRLRDVADGVRLPSPGCIMATNLVIVESPTKASTIEKYLGGQFRVIASKGHVRDLPRSDFAVEVDGDDASLRYEVPGSATDAVKRIRKEVAGADRVYLATDLDREGEAIAWHVAEVAGLASERAARVVFTEITPEAIREAFEQPRPIDDDLVNAQQARRAVDRIVGYRLSPTLWRNVASGISAGRVQSAALRMICDREDEIRAFTRRTYWTLHGDFARDDRAFAAALHSVDGRKLTDPKDHDERVAKGTQQQFLVVDSEEAAQALVERSHAADTWTVAEVVRRETKQNPAPPFTTSTLQQEAERKLGFNGSRTMRLAQQLYEGIDVDGSGPVGLITYMRTDSVNLASSALAEIGQYVRDELGSRYALNEPRRYSHTSKGAQEAHEAIRPTGVGRTPRAVATALDADQRKLYELVWKRTVATQMAPAVFDSVRADVVATDAAGGELSYRITGRVRKFDGFISLYLEGRDEGEHGEAGEAETDALPELAQGETLTLRGVTPQAHETQPPPRYTGASLVKALEAEGIGRPSTYASIIQTLVDRDYVRTESRRFVPTPLGEVVTAYLKQHFTEIVDLQFTARMEGELDDIAAGAKRWEPMVVNFLSEVDDWIAERKPERPRIPLDGAACPECEASMEKVFSGKSRQWFASCEKWPDCNGTLPLDAEGNPTTPEELEPDESVPCPECGKGTIRREGRFGPFYGCQDYPKCKGIVNVERRSQFACPTCGDGTLVQRTTRYNKAFFGCNRYPECTFALWTWPLAQPCPHCGGPLKPPRRNAKNPVGTCAGCGEKTAVDNDPPRAEVYEHVPTTAPG
jgi:DNA topoisomerase-1